ncbi:probable cytochrome P450 6a14 [Scaptodrosophila lebanonensis]|uniref:Probable cytochrome P450 6a14 n=1 Tax=Drosophila lebanonensis TaxID=7225 RepID=A0A6J2TYH3_DROLE|nr:probable cytochrome P450 6a14 [Scaptodrosophila lebanonensis]
MSVALFFAASLLSFLLGYLRYTYNYWTMLGVRQRRTHFLYGNVFKLKSLHLSELLQETYDAFKGKVGVAGSYVYTRPIAVVTDLELAKHILIKDFNKFVDRRAYNNHKEDPLSAHLFNLQGEQWRQLRMKLTPAFSSGKLKHMFGSVVDVAKQLELTLQKQLDKEGAVLELHDLLGRYTTDVIGKCAFGLDCHSLQNPRAEFRVVGRQLFQADRHASVRWQLFKLTYGEFFKRLGLRLIPKSHTDFIMRVVRETVASRESRAGQDGRRNDFIDLLLDLKNPQEGGKGLSVEQLAAQVFVFFVAGFETSSSNMSFALYELAKQPRVQQKLRSEILRVLSKHEALTYEAMLDMTYLDQVVYETLRKYPALASLTRIATEEYTLPGGDSHITLDRGTVVHIPVRAIHYDPEIYAEPQEFRPERFEAQAWQQRHPLAFLGFGVGPRNCIGSRFGLMQVKLGLIGLLRQFQFRLPGSGERPAELAIAKTEIILMPIDGVWLRVERLERLPGV